MRLLLLLGQLCGPLCCETREGKGELVGLGAAHFETG